MSTSRPSEPRLLDRTPPLRGGRTESSSRRRTFPALRSARQWPPALRRRRRRRSEGERGQKLGREGQRGGDDLPKHRHGHHGRVEGESVHESPLVRVGVCYDFCSSVRSVGVGCADANTTTKTRKHAGRGDCNVRSQHLARSLRLLSPCRLVPLNLVALYRSTKQHPRAS